MASEIKVNNIKEATGTTVTLGDGAGKTVTVDAATINLGRCGGTVTLACGATSSGFGAITWCSSIKTALFTAEAGKGYFINTCGGGYTVTLPATASVGDQINFTDYARTWGTTCKELTLNTNSLNFQGNTCPNPIYDTEGATVKIVYSGATQGWLPQLDKGTELETPQTYNVQYMIVGGGGGGGNDRGAGGGAGGQRYVCSKSFTLTPCTSYPIVIGAGGPGSPPQSNGTGSTFSTITSAGGGTAGGSSPPCGAAGNTPPTPCTQGYAGGNGTPPAGYQSGGGGGGAEVGVNGTPGPAPSGPGGPGGDGNPTAIFATPNAPSYGTPGPAPGRYLAGGGGGSGGSPGAGGDGCGGAGGGGDANATGAGDAGTVNTGGGGGGDANVAPGGGGQGGSGIVILRRVTACSTSTSGNVVTVCGSDTVHIFTGDGTFVA